MSWGLHIQCSQLLETLRIYFGLRYEAISSSVLCCLIIYIDSIDTITLIGPCLSAQSIPRDNACLLAPSLSSNAAFSRFSGLNWWSFYSINYCAFNLVPLQSIILYYSGLFAGLSFHWKGQESWLLLFSLYSWSQHRAGHIVGVNIFQSNGSVTG